MASRVAASLLKATGLDELVCSTLAEYEELAVNLAEDESRLFTIRDHLLKCRESCAAFDTKRWTKNFESALVQVLYY